MERSTGATRNTVDLCPAAPGAQLVTRSTSEVATAAADEWRRNAMARLGLRSDAVPCERPLLIPAPRKHGQTLGKGFRAIDSFGRFAFRPSSCLTAQYMRDIPITNSLWHRLYRAVAAQLRRRWRGSCGVAG